jgi:hypothetical protein
MLDAAESAEYPGGIIIPEREPGSGAVLWLPFLAGFEDLSERGRLALFHRRFPRVGVVDLWSRCFLRFSSDSSAVLLRR